MPFITVGGTEVANVRSVGGNRISAELVGLIVTLIGSLEKHIGDMSMETSARRPGGTTIISKSRA